LDEDASNFCRAAIEHRFWIGFRRGSQRSGSRDDGEQGLVDRAGDGSPGIFDVLPRYLSPDMLLACLIT
jgi:hypothetical protein